MHEKGTSLLITCPQLTAEHSPLLAAAAILRLLLKSSRYVILPGRANTKVLRLVAYVNVLRARSSFTLLYRNATSYGIIVVLADNTFRARKCCRWLLCSIAVVSENKLTQNPDKTALLFRTAESGSSQIISHLFTNVALLRTVEVLIGLDKSSRFTCNEKEYLYHCRI